MQHEATQDDRTAQMIELKDITLQHEDAMGPILSHFSLTVAKGEIVVLLGRSGSGKSSIFKLLTGEAAPSSGVVSLNAQPLPKGRSALQKYRQRIGAVFQDLRLLEEKTVLENLSFPLEIEGRLSAAKRRERIAEVLARFGLSDLASLLPKSLSKGEQQRVAIARAVVTEPLVLLADEPTAQLDSSHTETIVSLIKAENRRGMTVLLGTYDSGLATSLPGARIINLA